MKTCFKIPDSIDDYAKAVVPVGSRVVCNPPPMDTDQDLLVLVEDSMQSFLVSYLEKKGWEYEGDEKYDLGDFDSYRKTIDDVEYNVILAYSEKWFDLFLDATLLCKKENALDKKRRIEIFDEVFKKDKVKYATKDYLVNWAKDPFIIKNANQTMIWDDVQAYEGGLSAGLASAIGILGKNSP